MIPNINKDYICIANREDFVLASVVSSYLYEKEKYLPLFEFGITLCRKEDFPGGVHPFSISHGRAEEVSVRTYNASQFLSPNLTVILIGIDENQRSYLEWVEKHTVIEINDFRDVEIYFGHLVENKEALKIKSVDTLSGLFLANQVDKYLVIDENSDPIVLTTKKSSGLVVIESSNVISDVIGINFANSICADVHLIQKPTIERREVVRLIELWKKEDNEQYLRDLGVEIYPSIEGINFEGFSFVTFFTGFIPYHLVLEEPGIPVTYVSTIYHPDFFVFNGIIYEKEDFIPSGIIFSPKNVGENDETNSVLECLKSINFYVRELINSEATNSNIGNYISHYPFQVLHICSHGGQVDGYNREISFKDESGIEHKVEFDEIVTFAPEKGEEMIQVESKYIVRKFNGFTWRSKDLKDQNYPETLMARVFHEIMKNKDGVRIPKSDIVDSCGIICYDFFYQAMFNTLAGNHNFPFIFNNTCWSWLNISERFLALGARGYIGTLWKVSNKSATDVAERFYREIQNSTLLEAFQKAKLEISEENDINVYAFWGLHFSTIKSLHPEKTKLRVADRLLHSLEHLKSFRKSLVDQNIAEKNEREIRWIANEIMDNFQQEVKYLYLKSKLNQNK